MRMLMLSAVVIAAAAVTYLVLRGDDDGTAQDPAGGPAPHTERPEPPMQADPPETPPRTGMKADAPGASEPVPSPVDDRPKSPEVKRLLEEMNSEDNDVAFQAIVKLAELKEPAAIDPLIEILKTHRDFYARLGAATALGSLASWRATDALIDGLGDRDQLVRTAANEALRAITGHEVSGFKADATEDERAGWQRKWRDWVTKHKPR